MSFMIVAVAFASLSTAQASDAGTGAYSASGAELSGANREEPRSNAGEGVEANGERRICRRLVESGSHRYRRVCLTAEQWRQQDD